MNTAIIDYGAGNLHSVLNSFRKVAGARDEIFLCRDVESLTEADRVVLPGVGAYAHCREGLDAVDGMVDALDAFVKTGRPFLGICVGMQLMVQSGLEHGELTEGLRWISGDVRRITPNNPAAKIPHMGWNSLNFAQSHPLFDGIEAGSDVYFVHSYASLGTDPSEIIATTDYEGEIVAAIGRENLIGTQFHPEKSQKIGLKIVSNFLHWRP